jgi:N-dimethylarginine dimethylaminohydrolase
MKLEKFSAYHGGSWKTRESAHDADCARPQLWPACGLNSEFAPLKEVTLYRPPAKPPRIASPEKVQHLQRIDWKDLRRELDALARAFEKEGVHVRRLEADWFPGFRANLMFVRDQFFMTPWGAILGRLASPARAGEEKWAQRALAEAAVPLLTMIRGRGTFEGADALWISPKEVLVGVGNRTNREGYLQLARTLDEFAVTAHAVPLPKQVQHLLGLLQIVAPGRALVRTEIAAGPLLRRLKDFEVLTVLENEEVRLRQAMNVVTLAENRVFMPTNCRQTRGLFDRHEITVAKELDVSQLIRAAGGIACATGIVARANLRMKRAPVTIFK